MTLRDSHPAYLHGTAKVWLVSHTGSGTGPRFVWSPNVAGDAEILCVRCSALHHAGPRPGVSVDV